MARTAITVTSVTNFLQGTAVTGTAGDAANDHSIDMSRAPKLHLMARNAGGSAVAFTIELAAGVSSFQQATSIAVSIDPSAIKIFPLDVPSDLNQSGGLINIDSADANFSDVTFWAYTWADTLENE